MEERHVAVRLEKAERDLHLTNHRLSVLEQEQLPRRVASMEPVVQRLEGKMDDLGDKLENGLTEVKQELVAQRGMIKGVLVTVAALFALIELIPILKELFS